MEARRLLKQKVFREKAKKKMLADPANKYTEEELNLYLFGTDTDNESERKAEEKKKLYIKKQSDLVKKYSENLKKSINILKESQCTKPSLRIKTNLLMNNISLNTFESWNRFRTSSYNLNFLIKYLKEPIAFSRKRNLLLCKKNLFLNYKQAMKNFMKTREGKWGDDYSSNFRYLGLPAHVANKFVNSLLKGNGFRSRRFLGNPGFISDMGRNRSVALILFTAICCSWFNKTLSSIKFGTIVLYDSFKFLHILESM